MSEGHAATLPGSQFLWRSIALGSGGAGAFLLGTGRGSLSVSILLLVVALASSGVLLGSGPQGPAVEGRLDLSARLGLGLLGGTLGGLVSALALWVLVEVNLTGLLRVDLAATWTGAEFLGHLGAGAVWGMVLGIVYDSVPGGSGSARGAVFGLAPALYFLFKVLPIDQGAGLLGVELGLLTFVFVVVLNLLWGMVAGATIGWGEVAEEAPVARPIDA